MSNLTVQKMLDSFDSLTMLQTSYTLGDQQEQKLRKMVAGIKLYKKYIEATDGILEAKRLTPAKDYAPNPNPLPIRESVRNNPSADRFSLSTDDTSDFIKNGIIGPFDVIPSEQAESLYHRSYEMFEHEFEENYLLGEELTHAGFDVENRRRYSRGTTFR